MLNLVDGNWSAWGSWTVCSEACGPGTIARSRICDNPPAQYGGTSCSGSSGDASTCEMVPCPSKNSSDIINAHFFPHDSKCKYKIPTQFFTLNL